MGYPLRANKIRTEKLLFPEKGGKYGKDARGSKGHFGWDLVAPTGTVVYAVGPGKITFVGDAGGLGKIIQLRFISESATYWAIYAHLSHSFVSVDDEIADAQPIGLTGNTGNAKKEPPHLHLEICTTKSLSKTTKATIDPAIVLGSFLNDYLAGGATYHESSYGVEISDIEQIERLGVQRTA